MMKQRVALLCTAFLVLACAPWAQSLEITKQPASLSLQAGEVANFKVTTDSPYPLSYSWMWNGIPLGETDRITGTQAGRLNLSPVLASDAGQYTVKVSDGTNTVFSVPATLVVNVVLPSFTTDPYEVHVTSGQTASFSAAATGTSPITYAWQRDGTNVVGSGRIIGAATPTLSIQGAVPDDSGWYSLTASNADGKVSSQPARLNVHTQSALASAAGFDTGALTTGGDASWYAQSAVSHDGNALSHDAIPDGGMTYIETTVYGPGQLDFWWKVSSEAPDLLQLLVNGVSQDRISGEVDWTKRTFQLGSGRQVLRWQYSKDGSIAKGSDRGFLDQVSFTPVPQVSLEVALNNPPLPLWTYGNDRWFGQTLTTHDGASTARSGYLGDSQSSVIQTTVSGPGWLSFFWKVSSEASDTLQLWIDSTKLTSISGEVDWTNCTVHIPWGQHTISWQYEKDYSISRGSDAGWLDEVSYRPIGLFDLTQASDWNGSAWTCTGQGPWFGQNEYSHDGKSAMQSSPILDNESATVDTIVNGPGKLVFKWKVSSESSDLLRFLVNRVEQGRISGEVDWIAVTNVLRPGENLLRWQYSKDYSVSRGADAGWVDEVSFVPAPPIPEAANNIYVDWSTSGNAAWFPETVTTHDGHASVRSGDITDNQSSTLLAAVTGPGPGSFYWKVSSETTDPVIFLIDGIEQARLSGEQDWRLQTFDVPAGVHTLAWRYQKDYSVSRGQDAAWVDQVSFVGSSVVLAGPTFKGNSFTLSVPSTIGLNYFLEYKDSLNDLLWKPLFGIAGTGAPLVLTDPTANTTQRFYRVRAE